MVFSLGAKTICLFNIKWPNLKEANLGLFRPNQAVGLENLQFLSIVKKSLWPVQNSTKISGHSDQ